MVFNEPVYAIEIRTFWILNDFILVNLVLESFNEFEKAKFPYIAWHIIMSHTFANVLKAS